MANSNVGVPPLHSITASGAAAAGSSLDGGVAHNYHSLFVVTGGGVTAGTVVVELSNDNQNWFAPASNSVSTIAAATAYSVTVGPFPFQFARARVSVAITGGTVDAYVASA